MLKNSRNRVWYSYEGTVRKKGPTQIQIGRYKYYVPVPSVCLPVVRVRYRVRCRK